MKHPVLAALSLALLAVSCRFAIPISETSTLPAPTATPAEFAWEDRSIFLPGLTQAYQIAANSLPAASMYRLQFEIDEELTHIAGTEEVHYVNNENVPLGDVWFRLFPNILGGEMQVLEVLVNGGPVTPSYSLGNSLLVVPLPTPLKPGQSADLAMDFALRVPDTVELNYGVLASAGGVLSLAHAYPAIPVYNEEGWNAELPPQSGDLTFADMSFFIVNVRAPRNLVLVAVGNEVSRIESAGMQDVTYAAGPVRDFYLAASPDYSVISDQAGETRINFYAPASLRDGAREGLEVAHQALEDYAARYIHYPYTELDIVATPTLALGVEYPGMIAMAERIIAPADVFLEATMAHEVGHQWFYNLIGNDQLDHPWLDESLTQFVTLEYFMDEYGMQGANAFRESLNARWERVGHAHIPIGLPVADYPGAEYGAVVYGRGALFFQALQQHMGRVTFDAFLRDYAQTYSWKIATPEALKGLAEEHCACDLTPLFDQWVYP